MKTKHNSYSSKFNNRNLILISFRSTVFVLSLMFFSALNTGTAFSQTVTKQIIRLQVSNNNISDETVILFMENATEGYDYYDSPKMMNDNVLIPEIYTMIGTEAIVINTMPPLTADKDITLAFKTGLAGTFTITNNEFSNFPAGTTVKLINNINGDVQIISNGSVYTFTSGAITKNDMFKVRIELPGTVVVNPDPTPTPDPNPNPNPTPDPVQEITFSVNENNRIMVTCNEVIVTGATLFVNSLSGRIEYKGSLTNTITVVNKKLSAGTYIVTVNNGGKVTSGKVIVSKR